MKIKVSLATLFRMDVALVRLGKLRLPPTVSYWFARDRQHLAKQIAEARQSFQLQHNAQVKELGEPDPDKPGESRIGVAHPNWKKFVAELNKLAEVEEEIDIHQFTLEDLQGPKDAPNHIESDDLLAIDVFIICPDAPPKEKNEAAL